MGYLIILLLPLQLLAREYYPGTYFDGMRLANNHGEVTVLEAPVFKEKDLNANVIFYFRKGDKINIHPAEFAQNRYRDLINIPQEKVDQYKATYMKEFPDEFFDDEAEVYYPEEGSRFYKVLLKSGRTGWILKDHIFLITADRRELSETVIAKDNTDYRIEEPLPKSFPLLQETGYRGYFGLGLGVSRSPNYPYKENVDQSAFGFTKSFDFTFLRQVKYDVDKRFFFGGLFNITSSSNVYVLKTRSAQEDYTSLSIGPLLMYDVWKTEEHIISIAGSIQFNFVAFSRIKQSDSENNISEERNFNSNFFSPRFILTYTKRNILENLDFIMGTNVIMDLAHSYEADGGTDNPSWWQDKSYERPTNVQTNYFLGVQTEY